MTNIMCLCDIFNCKINDLVHEDMVDINSLDEDIKTNVVKFKQAEQKKMKFISKFIYITAKIGKIIAIIGLVLSTVISIIGVSAVSSSQIDTTNKEITVFGNTTKYEITDSDLFIINNNNRMTVASGLTSGELETVSQALDLSKPVQTLFVSLLAVSLVGSLFVLVKGIECLEKLFKNIHENDTPFDMDNVRHIKNLAIYTILYFAIADILGSIAQCITSLNLNIEIEITSYIVALIILAISYVFKYGYEIQLDSKGKIYDNNEQ